MSRSRTPRKSKSGRGRGGLLRQLAVITIISIAGAALVFGGYHIGRNAESASAVGSVATQEAFVQLEVGTVERVVSFSGEVLPAPVRDVVTGGAGTISAVGVTDGAWLQPGDRVVDLDGLPVFVSDPEVFLPYRDLSEGDEGPDVAGLQTFLSDLGAYDGKIDGKFGRTTRKAVEAMYSLMAGRKQSTFLQSSVVLLDRSSQIDRMLVKPGAMIELGGAIASVIDGVEVVHAEVSPSTGRQLSVGDVVWLEGTATTERIEATIAEVSAPAASTDGRVLQVIGITVTDTSDISAGDKFRVTRVLETSAPDVLIAPVLAIQTDAGGATFVRVKTATNTVTSSERVVVTAGVSDGTRVVIEGAGLTGDTLIEVSSAPRT